MAPKPRKLVKAEDGNESSSSATVENEPVKVQLYDTAGMRSALDDCAREVILDNGYTEDVTTSNVKIAGGVISILIALYAQFGVGKFPGSWWIVFGCVASYVALTCVLNLYLQRAEADSFLICKPRKPSKLELRLSSHLARFDDQYTLIISLGQKRHQEHRSVKVTASLSKFFHADGFLSETAFKPEVKKLLAEFEAAVGQAVVKKSQ